MTARVDVRHAASADSRRSSRSRQGAPRRGGAFPRVLLGWGVLILLLALWQIAATISPSTYWPPPMRIVERMVELWIPNPETGVPTGLTRDIGASLLRMCQGLLLAVAAGVTLGIALGLSKRVEAYLEWILQFFRAVPPPTLFPVFLLLFGVSDGMRVALIAFGSVWPVLLNTVEGVRSIPPLTFEATRVFRISRVDRLFRIVLPAAAPKIMAGVRTSAGLAVILMVISEMIAATGGIGFQLIQAQRTFLTLDMWAAIAVLGIIGYLLNLIITVIERRALRWQLLGGKEIS